MSTSPPADRAPSLAAFLDAWLGQWPPQLPLDVVGSDRRSQPGWDGRTVPLLGVWAPQEGCVLSVPTDALDAVALLGGLEPQVLFDPAWVGAAAQAVGRPGARLRAGVLRAVEDPADLPDTPDLGTWVPRDHPALPAWTQPFTADEVLLCRTVEDDEAVGAVALKEHDPSGVELAVEVAPAHRSRGLARRLVATAARRVLARGAVALYVHDPGNVASARAADATGFVDRGWRVVDLEG